MISLFLSLFHRCWHVWDGEGGSLSPQDGGARGQVRYQVPEANRRATQSEGTVQVEPSASCGGGEGVFGRLLLFLSAAKPW